MKINSLICLLIGTLIGFTITGIMVDRQFNDIKTEVEEIYNYDNLKDEIKEEIYNDLLSDVYYITEDEYSHLEEKLTEIIYDELNP